CRGAWRAASASPRASAPAATRRRGVLRGFVLAVVDAHGHDLVVLPARTALGGAPGNRFRDELDGLEPALGLRRSGSAHRQGTRRSALRVSWCRPGPGAAWAGFP